jgi:hypothetical protein
MSVYRKYCTVRRDEAFAACVGLFQVTTRILAAVQHPYDFYPVGSHAVKQDVAFDGQASHAGH